VAGFRPFLTPAGDATEVRILYRVAGPDVLEEAFATDAGWDDWSGSLTPRLADGVHGSTRMLRSVPWSPLA
jgi:hypothetical protein